MQVENCCYGQPYSMKPLVFFIGVLPTTSASKPTDISSTKQYSVKVEVEEY